MLLESLLDLLEVFGRDLLVVRLRGLGQLLRLLGRSGGEVVEQGGVGGFLGHDFLILSK